MTRVFLAIDGGNSKTDVVLADTTGALLGHARGPGSSPHDLGADGSAELLDELVGEALGTVVGGPPMVERAEVFLAGVDLPFEVEEMTVAVGTRGWANGYVVENDTFALQRAGLSAADAAGGAVTVVCGAGINCVGRAGDGRTARFPSLGLVSGDWGGGEHLAGLALWHAARGEDGRGPSTALVPAVPAQFGLATVEEASIAVHLGVITRSRLTELCPVLLEVAAAGDHVALGVVEQMADEIVAMARVAIIRLGLQRTAVPVVLGGGVMRAGWELLAQRVETGITAVAPEARLRLVDEPSVVGAALSGLDALGAPEEAHAALRAAVHATADRP